MFGLPFMGIIVAGSFVLTPATAVRYEKHDRKVRQMTKDEELNVRRSARKVDMKEEYYVYLHLSLHDVILDSRHPTWDRASLTDLALQRLAGRDIDDWEQKRVKRLPGENDGLL